MITNYKIKYKNNNSSCSQEFNNDYNDYNE
jgi:hypothetical protein